MRTLTNITIQKAQNFVMKSPKKINFKSGTTFDVQENPAQTCEVTIPYSRHFLFHSGLDITQNSTWYTNFFEHYLGGTVYQTTDTKRLRLLGAGRIYNMYLFSWSNTFTGVCTVTLLLNGAPTALTSSLTSTANNSSNIVDVVEYNNGDEISLKIQSGSGSGTLGRIMISAVQHLYE